MMANPNVKPTTNKDDEDDADHDTNLDEGQTMFGQLLSCME